MHLVKEAKVVLKKELRTLRLIHGFPILDHIKALKSSFDLYAGRVFGLVVFLLFWSFDHFWGTLFIRSSGFGLLDQPA